MAGDRQREISRTRADVENDVTLGERNMVDETVASHALARGHRDAEIIKGRQEVISCRWRVGTRHGYRVGHGRLLSRRWLGLSRDCSRSAEHPSEVPQLVRNS